MEPCSVLQGGRASQLFGWSWGYNGPTAGPHRWAPRAAAAPPGSTLAVKVGCRPRVGPRSGAGSRVVQQLKSPSASSIHARQRAARGFHYLAEQVLRQAEGAHGHGGQQGQGRAGGLEGTHAGARRCHGTAATAAEPRALAGNGIGSREATGGDASAEVSSAGGGCTGN